MSAIEDRVVKLTFDNAQFEAKVRQTLASLKNLQSGLKLDGAAKGLNDVSAAANRFSMASMGNAVDKVAGRFTAMSVVAVTALATITAKVASSAAEMAKSFTTGPITQGFSEYETQLGSIQTILSNTAAAGTTLKDVNATLQELNHYSDQTIYNFGEMARNIGTFTAAGVDLKTSTAAIKGIANLAALSGSNSQQASAAMYQLSQAISAGRVSLEDWNSVVNAGMGGTVFQRALAQTAEQIGTLDKGAVKLTGSMKNVTIGGKSFRESITAKPGQESWLTSEVLTKTLSQFTGDLKDAELAALGFDKAQIKAIQSQAKMAKNAATQVKTLSQLMGTLKESAASGWAQTWQLIFGDFGEAKTLFTGANNVLGGLVEASSKARNQILADWKKMGGRKALIEGISNAFKALVSFIRPIKDAFRDIFPAKTGKDLYNLTVVVRDFTKGLILGSETAGKLRRTFAGVFAIFGIGIEILKQLVGVFFNVSRTATEGSGGILDITARIGDFLVKLHETVKTSQGFKDFFNGLQAVLRVPIKLLQMLGNAIKNVFSTDTGAAQNLQTRLEPIGSLGDMISRAWTKAGQILRNVFDALEPVVDKITGKFEEFTSALSEAMSGADFSTFLDAVNTGLFAALVLMFKRFTSGGFFGAGGGGLVESITESFGELTGTLKAMQAQIKANTLVKIAGAIALLTASIVALSLIDTDKLTKALVALSAMFVQMAGVMYLLTLATAGAGALKLIGVSTALIALSIAVGLLTASLKVMSTLSWQELAKGLTGVVALLGALVGVSYALSANTGGMIRAGAALILIAGAVKLLASSVEDLSGMNWKELAKGLTGVGALLLALGLFSTFARANAGGALAGAGIVLLAAGIKILASALKDISDMSWGEMAKGLVGMAWGLSAIGAALILIPPSSVLSASAVLIAATSLLILQRALAAMGDMSWGDIATGLAVLASSLTIIGLAMAGMTTALPGAAALLVVSAALTIFVPVLQKMGEMSWGTIVTGLLTMGAAFTVIGVAGLLLAPVVPVLFGLAGSIALMGGAMALAGLGVLAFSAGLTALAVSGAAGAKALVGIVLTILGSVPKMVAMVGQIIIAFAKAIEAATPAVAKAAVTAISALLTAIVKLAPQILDAIGRLLVSFLQTLVRYVPKIVAAGANLIIAILNGIAQKIPGIVTAATNLIVAFLGAVSKNLPRVIAAGADLVISFINGVANEIRSSGPELMAAGMNLAGAIIEGMVKGLAAGVGKVASKAMDVAKGALNAAMNILGVRSPSKEFEKIGRYVNDGFVKGLKGNSNTVTNAFNTMRKELQRLMTSSAKDVDALEAKLKKLQGARKKDVNAIKKTTAALHQARYEQQRSTAAFNYASRALPKERDKLKRLANSYADVTKRLDVAKQTLADATKTRDDYKASITTQYSDLPEITENTKLADYLDSLRKQIVETKAFAVMLQKLRALGLNDTIYKELLAKGTDAMPFVSELLDSGKAGVKELNDLNKSLDETAGKLGSSASASLYQAAVDSAKGLVDGLAKQQKNIEIQMNRIATFMVNAIKKNLGIKSPSRVFYGIGKYTTQGLINGLEKTSGAVRKSTEGIGDQAVDGLRRSISDMRKVIGDNMDLSPTIRPVIDMSEVKKGAAKLTGLVPGKVALSTETAYGQAKSARAEYDANASRQSEGSAAQDMRNHVSYTQNNYSPKALSSADIYRQTKNQLSVAKGALD